jgi:hypothetical protein
MAALWEELGFTTSPYATDPVPPTEVGERLLVGRGTELRQLRMLLSGAATHPTIEGANGVGKTSLVAVAGYQSRRAYDQGETSQLLIPLGQRFQITPGETVDVFLRRLYFALAQAFIEHRKELATRDVPDTDEVHQWLNSPVFHSRGAGGSALGFGASGQSGESPNTGDAFLEGGFKKG